MTKNKNFSETSVGRYSLALYELADETNIVSEIEKQVEALLSTIIKSPDLDFFIKNPTTKKEDQENIIKQISNKFNLNELLSKFLCYLIHKRRFFYVEKILSDFIETCSKKRGEIKASLISSKELSQTELNDISTDLSNSMGSTLKFDYKVDKELIGGLKLQLGSIMIDTSIRNKLKKYEQAASSIGWRRYCSCIWFR